MFKINLQQDEKLVLIQRQTEWRLVKPVLVVFLCIYFPWYLLLKYELEASYSKALVFWTVLVLLYFGYQYLLWLLNVYILTNKRLIHVSYRSLAKKTVIDCPLNKIVNINTSTTGVFSALFGYGNLDIRLQGGTETFALEHLKTPEKFKEQISPII